MGRMLMDRQYDLRGRDVISLYLKKMARREAIEFPTIKQHLVQA